MVKRIGGGGQAKKIDFELIAYVGEDEVAHTFTALARQMPAELVHLTAKAETEPSKAAAPLVRLLGKLMSNKDGVPTHWEPVPLDKRDPAVPDDAEPENYYRDHEGTVRAYSDTETLEFLQDPANGSSRKRWQHLMENDDEAIVEMEDLLSVAEYLISEGSERPTVRRG